MAKLTAPQKKWLQTHFGKKHGEKRYGYKWDAKQKRWEKKKWHITPKKPPAPPPAKPKPVVPPAPPALVKTNYPITADILGAGAANFTYVTQAEMQREFAGMVALELWQYTNAEAVDGIFNNVKLILELTEIREQYNPNAIITSLTPFIKSVRRDSTNKLYIEIDGAVEGRHMLLEFFTTNTESIVTVDYV